MAIDTETILSIWVSLTLPTSNLISNELINLIV